jgi:hypothetical protein
MQSGDSRADMPRRLDEQDIRRRLEPLFARSDVDLVVPIHERKPGAFASFASLALRRYNDTAKFRELEARRLREWLSARGL